MQTSLTVESIVDRVPWGHDTGNEKTGDVGKQRVGLSACSPGGDEKLWFVTGVRLRFDGAIAGLGTASGTRMVLGHWRRSPFGAFSDVMLERVDGQRTLLAPTHQVAAFIADTYMFDDVRVVPVTVAQAGAEWTVEAAELRAHFTLGRRGPLGWMLRAVPAGLAVRPAWIACVDVPARVLPGVRMRGSAGRGRREWYGVHDLQPIATASVHIGAEDLGPLTPMHPPVRFGFASTPRRPAFARVATTVELAEHE